MAKVFDKPRSIPVIVETTNSEARFPFVRCVYFAVEFDVPDAGWLLTLDGITMPFSLLGLSGIILSPSPLKEEFTSPGELESLFERFESRSGFVTTSDIWLPFDLFDKRKTVERSNVFRLSPKLFSLAFAYRQGDVSDDTFLSDSREFRGGVRFSASDTRAIAGWVASEYDLAAQTLKDPNLALRPLDDDGRGQNR